LSRRKEIMKKASLLLAIVFAVSMIAVQCPGGAPATIKVGVGPS